MAVSRETIVKASIEILNRGGIEGLNMRALAKDLGIKAASLYWHIKGKQELYGEIAEQLCSQIAIPLCGGARKRLTELCKAYRSMLLDTRDSVAILEDSIPSTPHRIAIIKAQSDCLLELGVDRKNLMTAGNLLNNFVLSFVADEVRFKSFPEASEKFAETLSASERAVFVSDLDYDEQFLYGLDVIFAGMERVAQ
jgi:AcrR family transcriptional regulator